MEHTLEISAAELCRVLSAPPNTLNGMEQAVRDAIERANGPDKTNAIREQACLDASTPEKSEGKGQKTPVLLVRSI